MIQSSIAFPPFLSRFTSNPFKKNDVMAEAQRREQDSIKRQNSLRSSGSFTLRREGSGTNGAGRGQGSVGPGPGVGAGVQQGLRHGALGLVGRQGRGRGQERGGAGGRWQQQAVAVPSTARAWAHQAEEREAGARLKAAGLMSDSGRAPRLPRASLAPAQRALLGARCPPSLHLGARLRSQGHSELRRSPAPRLPHKCCLQLCCYCRRRPGRRSPRPRWDPRLSAS